MLEYLKLINFTSHKNTTLEFEKVNTIVGESESGKTNIWLAMKILLRLENFPDSLIRDGAEFAVIEAKIDDNIINLRRDKKTLTVTLNGKEYTGKKNLFETYFQLTKIRDVHLDIKEKPKSLNFIDVDRENPLEGQAETIKRKLAAVIGSSEIENAKILVARELRSLVSEKETSSAIIDSLEESLKAKKPKLELLSVLKEKIQHLESEISIKETVLLEKTRLEALISLKEKEIVTLEKTLQTKQKLLEKKNKLNELEQRSLRIQKLWNDYLLIQEKIAFLEQTLTQLKTSRSELLSTLRICNTCGQPLP